MRSISASSGSSAAQTAAHSSAPWTSPDGDETPTSASSSRAARRPISAAAVCTQESMTRHGNVFVVPELPEMEIVARRLDEALPGERIESALTPGINALKTFDPPFSAIDGATFTGARRRGKLLLLDVDTPTRGDPLTLLLHLMSAGRAQLFDKRASLRDKTSRVLFRLPERPRAAGARVRHQAARVGEAADAGRRRRPTSRSSTSPPRRGPTRPTISPSASKAPRPLHSLLRDQRVIAGIGRTWVDEILHAAQLSPFKRGDDLSDAEVDALGEAMVSELGRVIDVYEEQVQLPLPEKFPKPTRVHAHQGEPCPRCETVLEAVFYEDYVMSYCPHCQTEGRVLKDRRLSRLLK